MNFKNHYSPRYQQPHGFHQPAPYRPPSNDELLSRSEIHVEEKTVTLTLKENDRGRCLQITERKEPFRQDIIVPASGLSDFLAALELIMEADREMPASLPADSGEHHVEPAE